MSKAFIDSSDLILLVYDMCEQKSFDLVVACIVEIRKGFPDKNIAVLGNKSDLINKKTVFLESVQKNLKQFKNVYSIEYSVKNGDLSQLETYLLNNLGFDVKNTSK